MADNLVTTTTVATIPDATRIATREGSYSGQSSHVAPVILATASGADDAKTITDVSNSNPVPVSDAGGSLTVDGSVSISGTPTVSGTVTANAGTNLNTSALALEAGGNLAAAATSLAALDNIVAGSEAQVDVITLPALPAGSNNIGDVDVLSVVPGTGATNLGKAEDTPHASGDVGVMALAVRSDALTVASDTSGDYEPHHTDAAGALWVRESGAVPDDSAFVVALSRVQPVGFLADEASTDSVDEGDAGAARMTLDRRQIVVPQPHSAGGLSTFHSNDLDETEEDVKTAAGCVYGYIITNRTTAPVYIHFYNATAANVTVGTTAALFIFAVPGNATDYVAAHLLGGVGINFDTAISVAATTDFPDDGSPAGPAANGVLCTVFYK